jgi:hypothetical protein
LPLMLKAKLARFKVAPWYTSKMWVLFPSRPMTPRLRGNDAALSCRTTGPVLYGEAVLPWQNLIIHHLATSTWDSPLFSFALLTCTDHSFVHSPALTLNDRHMSLELLDWTVENDIHTAKPTCVGHSIPKPTTSRMRHATRSVQHRRIRGHMCVW